MSDALQKRTPNFAEAIAILLPCWRHCCTGVRSLPRHLFRLGRLGPLVAELQKGSVNQGLTKAKATINGGGGGVGGLQQVNILLLLVFSGIAPSNFKFSQHFLKNLWADSRLKCEQKTKQKKTTLWAGCGFFLRVMSESVRLKGRG